MDVRRTDKKEELVHLENRRLVWPPAGARLTKQTGLHAEVVITQPFALVSLGANPGAVMALHGAVRDANTGLQEYSMQAVFPQDQMRILQKFRIYEERLGKNSFSDRSG